jgi:hypothetical protein
MGQDEGGSLDLLDDVGDGEGLAGAGDTEQCLVFLSRVQSLDELSDGFRLVTCGCILGVDLE